MDGDEEPAEQEDRYGDRGAEKDSDLEREDLMMTHGMNEAEVPTCMDDAAPISRPNDCDVNEIMTDNRRYIRNRMASGGWPVIQ